MSRPDYNNDVLKEKTVTPAEQKLLESIKIIHVAGTTCKVEGLGAESPPAASSKAQISEIELFKQISCSSCSPGDEPASAAALKNGKPIHCFADFSSSSQGTFARGVCAVFGAFLMHLTLGIFFTLGNLSPYLISYLRSRVDSGVAYSQAVWFNGLFFGGQGLIMFLGGYLERKIGARWTCIIGATLFSGSVALSAVTLKISFLSVVITYGLTVAFGTGIAYVAVLALVMRWFPERKGLVTGLTTSGFGLSSFIFSPLQTAFINPLNKKMDNSGYYSDTVVLDSVPSTFLYMASIYASIQIVSVALLFPVQRNKEKKCLADACDGQKDHTSSKPLKPDTENQPDNTALNNLVEINTKAMMKHKEFYMLWLIFACNILSSNFTNTFYKVYGGTFVADDHFLTTIWSVAAICNCLGRVGWGHLLDKTSYKVCMGAVSGGLMLVMATFGLCELAQSRTMLAIWTLAFFCFYSGIFTLMPTAIAKTFGQEHAGPNYGILFTAPALVGVCGAPFLRFLLDNLQWAWSFCTLAGLNLTAFIITMMLPKELENVRHPKKNS